MKLLIGEYQRMESTLILVLSFYLKKERRLVTPQNLRRPTGECQRQNSKLVQ